MSRSDAYASAEAATSVEIPTAEATAQTARPETIPRVVGSTTGRPARSTFLSINAMSGPGEIVIRAATPVNATSDESISAW